jgi:hypothetical protein
MKPEAGIADDPAARTSPAQITPDTETGRFPMPVPGPGRQPSQ